MRGPSPRMTMHKRFKLNGNRSSAADKPSTRITIYGLAHAADLREKLCGESTVASNLIQRALEVVGERIKQAAATSLQKFIARRSQKQLLGLMRKLEWDPSFDYKAERTRD
jgi:hypothetical protein